MPILSEKMFINMDRLARRKKIKDKDLIDFYQSFSGTKMTGIPFEELTNEEKAEDLAYEILEFIEMNQLDFDELVNLRDKAMKALKLDPKCLAAYEAAYKIVENNNQRDQYIIKGAKIGEEKYGGEYEKKNIGHFWQITVTRPYLRLLAAKAEILVNKSHKKDAMLLYERIWKLNPDDAMGVRYPLQVLYLEFRQFDNYIDLIDEFEDDYSVHNYFNYALFLYITDRDSEDTFYAMLEAIKFNPFVLPYLRSQKKLDRDKYLSTYSPIQESGAIIYCQDALYLWHRQFGIQTWLRKF